MYEWGLLRAIFSLMLESCCMLPTRSKIASVYCILKSGGVVDPYFKVYGLANVRDVDASVIPMHIAAHPSHTVYALAEKVRSNRINLSSKPHF